MIRFNDSNIFSYKLIYLNLLISISIENTVSEKLGAIATAIAIIQKEKALNEKETKNCLGEALAM